METGYLTIGTYPNGAKIYLDDALILVNEEPLLTPASLSMSTGYHNIKLALDGYCDEFDGQYIEKNENVNIFHNFYVCQ